MLSQFIKYFFISFCTICICLKILNYQPIKWLKIFTIFFSGILAFIISTLPSLIVIQRIIVLLLFISIYVSVCTKINYLTILLTLIIALALSLVIYSISGIVVALIFFIKYRFSHQVPFLYTYLITGFLQIFLTNIFISIKRFINGIRIVAFSRKPHIGILFSFTAILSTLLFSIFPENVPTPIQSTSFLLICLFSVFLLYYWRHRITQTYLENMRRLETLNYENTIADKDKHIKELEDNNAYLGRIIHKYRKIIPAMEISVMELLQNNEGLDAAELKHKAESLQIQLDEIHAERDNLFDNYQKQTIASTQTGLHTVDAMLVLMEKRAKQDWIQYKMQIAPNIKELSLNSIKETDLLHLLGDLIENAIHAVNVTDTKDILIHLGRLNNFLLLEVSDSGIAFDIQTYQHFGNESYTTHTENGGTGTGLMDIWSIKKKYKASLYIYEYESSSNNIYTKKISFLFDGKNHFLLKTYRDKEIKNSLIRGDLHVFPHDTE